MIRLAILRRSRPVISRRLRRAFTLIEVLIAAFIISIGVIGLLALFAGAARQQQGASQITQSVFFSNSSAAILRRNLGRLAIPQGAPLNCRPEDDRWYPVHMDDQEFFLTLDGFRGCNCDESPFFIVPLSETQLFSTNDLMFQTSFGFFDDTVLGAPPPGLTSLATPPWNNLVDPFAGRDLDPDSIRIRVTLIDTITDEARELNYFRAPGDDLSVIYPSIDDNTNIFVLPLNANPGGGGAFGTNPNYVAIDVSPCTASGIDPARLAAVSVQSGPGFNEGKQSSEYISEIVLIQGDLQARDLISFNDRLRFRIDPGVEDDRRPEMGFSLLWRQKGSVLQALIASYQLIPPNPAARWLPPERRLDYPGSTGDRWEDSPLRRVDLDLGYDLGLQQYFVELVDDDDLWAIQPNQILIVEGDPSQGNSIQKSGSDGAVRVLRQQTLGVGNNAQVRGLLERGPRFDGRSYLSGQDFQDEDTVRLRFIAINDIVRSDEDGTDWRLRPLAATVIQVTTN